MLFVALQASVASLSQVASAAVPSRRLRGIGLDAAKAAAPQKPGIEGHRQPKRRTRVSHLRGALIKQASRCDIAGGEETVSPHN